MNKNNQYCFPPDFQEKLSKKLIQSVLSYEDNYFFYHFGINPYSLIRALYLNFSKGKVISGGSTLTMQVARMINSAPRTYYNKLKEIIIAFKLELFYSKNEILKLYLNHAPYGGNLRGIIAACKSYFGKDPTELSWAESTTLAVLPNAPGKITPFKNKNLLLKKRNKLLKTLKQQKIISESTYKLSVAEKLPKEIFLFPFKAPHFTEMIKNRYKDSLITKTVKSSLNLKNQRNVSDIVNFHMNNLYSTNVNNCAALVVDVHTGEIKSYLGSNDYFDFKNSGQVDCILSQRSTGSTLKPFLYALAIDKGIILPQSLVIDVPTNFGSFSPANASGKYSGLVTAKKALASSLNVPAVSLLKEYGYLNFYNYLADENISGLRKDGEEYGLTIILGGAEVKMIELAQLYLNMASYKNPQKISFQNSNIKAKLKCKKLISDGANYLTLEMLTSLKRPGLDYYWQYFSQEKKIAWKTGTSFGGKDAWACGVTPDWLVIVWAGNFSGEGIPDISGFSTAAPIMLNIFNYLLEQKNSGWFAYPDSSFKEIVVSKNSGYRLSGNLTNKSKTEIVIQPKNAKPLKLSPYEKKIYLNKDGYEVCSSCWDYKTNVYHDTVLTIYPSLVNQYLRNQGVLAKNYPKHYPSCKRVYPNNQLEIVYPQDGSILYLPINLQNKKQKIILRAAYNQSASILYWHLNDKYLGLTRGKHKFKIDLPRGKYKLYVNDQKGSGATSSFEVLSK